MTPGTASSASERRRETDVSGVGRVIAQLTAVPGRTVHGGDRLITEEFLTDGQMIDRTRGAVEMLCLLRECDEAEAVERRAQRGRTRHGGEPERRGELLVEVTAPDQRFPREPLVGDPTDVVVE